MAHKAKFRYNPNRNTALDKMIREEKEQNEKKKKDGKDVVTKLYNLNNHKKDGTFMWKILCL